MFGMGRNRVSRLCTSPLPIPTFLSPSLLYVRVIRVVIRPCEGTETHSPPPTCYVQQ